MTQQLRKPPVMPYPHVRTAKGQIMYEWNEACQDWIAMRQPQTWLEKLLGEPGKLVYEPKGECD